jgi:hypothetical protein
MAHKSRKPVRPGQTSSNSAAMPAGRLTALRRVELLALLLRLSDELDVFFEQIGAPRETSKNRESIRGQLCREK